MSNSGRFGMVPEKDLPLHREILAAVAGAAAPLTPKALAGKVRRRIDRSFGQVRLALRDLVGEGKIAYTYRLGTSFVERSFRLPVRIGDRLAVGGADVRSGKDGAATVRIQTGAAFGGGEHPTTRLCLIGLDRAIDERPLSRRDTVLDIGTGTGILAISALMLGAGKAWAIDIDPCAVAEARANARLNGVQERIQIFDGSIAAIPGRFDLVFANLRLPTLKEMAPLIEARAAAAARVVLSGIRDTEIGRARTIYAGFGLAPLWTGKENGWGAMVLSR